jgi:hypothetical protein
MTLNGGFFGSKYAVKHRQFLSFCRNGGAATDLISNAL